MLRLIIVSTDTPLIDRLANELPAHSALIAATDRARSLSELSRRLCAEQQPHDLALIDQRSGSDQPAARTLRTMFERYPDLGLIVLTDADERPEPSQNARLQPCCVVSRTIHAQDLAKLIELFSENRASQNTSRWLEVLTGVTERIQHALDVAEVERLAVQGGRALHFERARLWLISPDGNWLILAHQDGNRGLERRHGFRVPIVDSWYTQQALASREPRFFIGQEAGEGFLDRVLATDGYEPPIGEWVHMPLWAGDRCWGVLALDNANRSYRLRQEQRALVALFGGQISAARERARLFELERRKAAELEVLNTISSRITERAARDDLDGLLHEVWQQVGRIVDARNFMVVMLNHEEQLLDYRLHIKDNKRAARELSSPHNTLIGHVIEHNRVLYLPDGCAAYRQSHNIPLRREPARSYLAVPLQVESRAVGAIAIQSYTIEHAYSDEDVRLLTLVMRQVAAAIQVAYAREVEAETNKRLATLQQAGSELLRLAEESEALFWHVTLTVATAGYGFGFNRAVLLLAEEKGALLRGEMGIGCLSVEETLQHWAADEQANLTFKSYLRQLRYGEIEAAPINDLVRQMVYPVYGGEGALAIALGEGRRVIVPASSGARHLPPGFIKAMGVTDYAVLPLRDSGRIIGLLIVDNLYTCHPLRPALLDRLETFLAHICLLRENVAQRRQLNHLIDLTHSVLAEVGSHDLGQTLTRIALAAQQITDADCVLIYAFVPNREPLEYASGSMGRVGLLKSAPTRDRPRPNGITAQIVQSGTLVVSDVSQCRDRYDQCLADHPFLRREGICAFIGTPVRDPSTSTPIGVLYLNYRSARHFSQHEQRQCEAFASLGAAAIRADHMRKDTLADLRAIQGQSQARDRELGMLHQVLAAALEPDAAAERTAAKLLHAARQLLDLPDIALGLLLRTRRLASPNHRGYRELRHQYHLRPDGQMVTNEEPHVLFGISGRAFETGETQCANNVRRLPWSRLFEPGLARNTRSEIDVPIRLDGEVIAVFNIESPHAGAFTAEHQMLMEGLARVAQLPLTSIRRREELRQERDRLQAAMDVTRAVGANLDLELVLSEIMQVLAQLLPDVTPCVLLYDPDDSSLVFTRASRQLYPIDNPDYIPIQRISIDHRGIACAVARCSLLNQRSEIEVVDDVSKNTNYLPLISTTRSELCVSLVHNHVLQGVLILESETPKAFSSDGSDVIISVAQQISIAIALAHHGSELRFKSQLLALTAWAAQIAHDLNREINCIRNRASWLRDEAALSEEGRAWLREIDQSADRLRGTIAEVSPYQLNPELNPQAQLPIPREAIALDSWLRHAIEQLIPRYPDIQLSFDLCCGPLEILAVPAYIQRVIGHLIRNAAHAMGERGEILVRSRLKGQQIEVLIANTGPSVPEELRSRIFREPVKSADREGGLGLLIVRYFVEQVGGRIRLVPEPHGLAPHYGAVFAFTLPLRHEEAE